MKFLKNIVIILMLLMAHHYTMAHETPKLFSFEETSLGELSGEAAEARTFIKRSFIASVNKSDLVTLSTTSAFYKQTVIRKQKSSSSSNDLLTKLIRSNLKLSFRVSKTLNLSISYL